MRRFSTLLIVTIIVAGLLPTGIANSAPPEAPRMATASSSTSIPASTDIGQQNIPVTVSFDNTGTPGYGPILDIVLDTTGVDPVVSDSIGGIPGEGLFYVAGSMSYNGISLSTTVQYFPATDPDGDCAVGLTPLDHPFYVNVDASPMLVCGTPGDTLLTVELPFGSVVEEQPTIPVDFEVHMSDHADLGQPINIWTRSGFQFGENPLDDFCCGDPPIYFPNTGDVPAWPASSTTPTIIEMSKFSDAHEGETATGPNFPVTWTIDVDVATGQTVTNLDVTDLLPNNIVITAISPGTATNVLLNGAALSLPEGPIAAGSNELTWTYASITGAAGVDASFDVTFYFPLRDATGALIINDSTGNDSTSENTATALGDWTPIDPDDTGGTDNVQVGPCPNCPGDTVTPMSIAIQKNSNAAGGGNYPGDIITFTLDFQISDFFAFQNGASDVIITDYLEDGLRLVGSPTINFDDQGTQILSGAAITPATTILAVDTDSSPLSLGIIEAGAQELVFNLDDVLGDLFGSCVPKVGVAGDPTCGALTGGTQGTITYTAAIQYTYDSTFASGDASVDQGDDISNHVSIYGSLLDITNPSNTTGNIEEDTSGEGLTIIEGSLTKDIYAINGVAPSSNPAEVAPGDVVSYRITYTLPTSDIEDLTFIDYLPLPVFDVDDYGGFTYVHDDTLPYTAGTVQRLASDTFSGQTFAGPPPSDTVPSISFSSAANSVTISYGDFDNGSGAGAVVDLLLHVEVNSDPFADRLFLTNQAEVTYGTTQLGSKSASDIVQIILTEPFMGISKGGVSSSQGSASTPFTTGGATFLPGGDTSAVPFTGVISSTAIGATPVTDDVSGVDAGDIVRFAIILENQGSSVGGAFDLQISDILPAGYAIPTGGLNMQAALGDRSPLSVVSLGGTAVNNGAIFVDGVEIQSTVDPTLRVCQGHDPATGSNIVVVTYDLIVADAAEANSTNTNTAQIDRYAGTDGGTNHVVPGGEPQDDSETLIASPSIAKSITTIDPGHINTSDRATIGEIITYEVVVTVPEGIMTNMTVVDNMDNILALFDIVSITASPGVGLDTNDDGTVDSTDFSGVITNAETVATGNYGDPVPFTFGTVANENRDNGVDETITITYQVVVLDITGNVHNSRLRNTATLDWGANDGTYSAQTTARTREPLLEIDKTVTGGADAGDQVEVTLRVFHTAISSSDAFNVTLSDTLPAGFVFVSDAYGPGIDFDMSSCPATPTVAPAHSGGVVTAAWDTIPDDGSECTVTFQVSIDTTVTAGEDIDNTGSIAWTSTDDTQPDGDTYDGRGHERSYTDDDTDTFTVIDPAITKDLYTGTPAGSQPATTDPNTDETPGSVELAIGEEISYLLTVTVPDGTNTVTVTDSLPASATDGYMEGLYAEVLTMGADLTPGTLNVGDTVIPTDSGSDGIADTITFSFGSIVNAPDIVTSVVADNQITLLVTARVVDDSPTPVNVAGFDLVNNASVTTDLTTVSTTYTVPVVEPDLTIDKAIIASNNATANATISGGNITRADAGDIQTFEVTVENTSTDAASAYNVVISDALIPEFILANVAKGTGANVTITGTTGTVVNPVITTGNALADTTIQIDADRMDPGATITFTYQALVDYTAMQGETYTNTATVDFGSQPDVTPEDRDYLHADDPTDQEDTATTTLEVSDAVKSIVASSENHTDASDSMTTNPANPTDVPAGNIPVAVGEIVRYQLAVSVPEGLSNDLQIVDQLSYGIVPIFDDTMEVTTLNFDPTGTGFTATDFGAGLEAAFTGTVDLYDSSSVAQFTAPHDLVTYDSNTGSATYNLLTLDFGDITNNDSDADTEWIVITFNVLVANESPNGTVNALGDIIANDFDVNTDGFDATPDLRDTSNTVNVLVQEPNIDVFTKSITGSTNAAAVIAGGNITDGADAGDRITYTITVTNDNAANVIEAYEVRIYDDLAAPGTNLDLISVTVAATYPYGVTDSSDLGTDIVDVTLAQLDAGQSVDITVVADLRNATAQDSTIENIAELTYTGLPGSGTTSNPTGSDIPGASGDDDGERNGDDGAAGSPNNYADTDNATIAIDPSSIVEKAIIATNDNTTDDTGYAGAASTEVPVAVGEIVTFQLAVDIPEGTTNNITFVDALVAGLAYVPNSTRVYAFNADNAMAAANLSGPIPVAATNPVDPTTEGLAVLDGAGVGTSNDTGGTITINLGQIVNDDSDADIEYIIVTFEVVIVDDTLVNYTGQVWLNDFQVTTDGTTLDLPDAERPQVEVVEPELAILKGITYNSDTAAIGTIDGSSPPDSDIQSASAGDIQRFTLTITNNGNATAYDVVIVDDLDLVLPTGEFTLVDSGTAGASDPTVVVSSGTADLPATPITVVGNRIQVNANSMADGAVLTVTYDVLIDETAQQALTYTNTASVDYGSQPDSLGGTDDRDYTDETDDADTVMDASYIIEKEIYTSSDTITNATDTPDAGGEPVAIGEEVTFQLTIDIPEGTSPGVIFVDRLIPGIDYVDGSTEVYAVAGAPMSAASLAGATNNIPAVATPAAIMLGSGLDVPDAGAAGTPGTVFFDEAGTRDVIINLGNVVNHDSENVGDTDSEYVVVTFNVVVIDGVLNTAAIWANDFTATAGVTNLGPSSPAVGLGVVEPDLTITKGIILSTNAVADATLTTGTAPEDSNITDADAGDTQTFLLTIQNTGDGPAYDVVVGDTPPTPLNIFTSCAISSVTFDDGSAAAYSGDLFTTNLTLDNANPLMPGGTIDAAGQDVLFIEYTCDITTAAAHGDTYTNTATVDYTSQPGSPTHDHTYTQESDDATTTIETSSMVEKAIIATNDSNTDDTGYTGAASTPVPVAVGEVVTFQLAVDIPEGTTNNITFTDVLVSGLGYVTGSTRVYALNADNAMAATSLSGPIPVAAANPVDPTTEGLAVADGAGVGTSNDASGTITINLGQIVNDDSDADIEYIVVTFDVVILDTGVNDTSAIWANDFEVNSDGTINNLPDPDRPQVAVDEPVLTLAKNITASDNVAANATISGGNISAADAGDTQTFVLTVTNTGDAAAYDVTLTDTPPAPLNIFTGCAISANGVQFGNGDNATYTGDLFSTDIVLDNANPLLATGDANNHDVLTITYTCAVDDTVRPDTTYTNTATVDYTSQPGTPATGNDRDYTDETDDATTTTPVSSMVEKAIIATNDNNTDDTGYAGAASTPVPVAVGEVVTFQLAVDVPEGTTDNITFTDILVEGLEYVAGSAEAFAIADAAMSGTNLTGSTNNIPTSANPVIPGLGLEVTDGAGVGTANYVSGTRTITVNLGEIVNNDNDAGDEYIVVTFDVVVLDAAVNTTGHIWLNDFQVNSDGEVLDLPDAERPQGIIVQPSLSILKGVTTSDNAAASTTIDGSSPPDSDISNANAGDTQTFTLTITNNGNATAYDVAIADLLDAVTPSPEITLVDNSVTTTAGTITNQTGNGVGVGINELAAGASVTITYQATIDYTAYQGYSYTNTAYVDYSSQPLTPATGNDRNYDDETDDAITTLESSGIEKAIINTSSADTDNNQYPGNSTTVPVLVGEVVTFQLAIDIPEGTSNDVILTDVLVPGLLYLAGSTEVYYTSGDSMTFASLAAANGANGAANAVTVPDSGSAGVAGTVFFDTNPATRSIVVNLGDILNSAQNANVEQVVVTFDVVVDHTATVSGSGDTNSDGINNLGDIWANEFTLNVDGSDIATAPDIPGGDNPVSVLVTEPVVRIDKSFDVLEMIPGGTVVMTLVVDNLAAPSGATAPLYDVNILDTLDDWLEVTNVATVLTGTAATSSSTDNSVLTPGYASGVTDEIDIDIDVIPVGGVATVTVTMVVDPSLAPTDLPRTITNRADVTGHSIPDSINNPTDDWDREYSAFDEAPLDIVHPDIVVSKTDDVDPVSPGSPLTYTIVVTNADPDFTASNVVMSDTLPAGFNVTLVQTTQGTCSPLGGGLVLNCALGTLTPGDAVTITVDGLTSSALVDGDTILNEVIVTSAEGNGNDGNNTPDVNGPETGDDEYTVEPTDITRGVDLVLTKNVDDPSPNEGDLITYTMVITNNGPSDTNNVVFTDDLPDELTFSAIVPSTLVTNGNCAVTGDVIDCTFASLVAGDSITIGVEATVDAGTSFLQANIPNTAFVTSDDDSDDDTATIFVDGVDLAVTKTVDNATPAVGDTIVYTVTVRNNGPAPATGIELIDILPTGINYASDNSFDTLTTYTSGTGIWELTGITLDAGDELSLEITAEVDASASSETQPIVNTASLNAVDQYDSDPTNNSDDANVVMEGLDLRLSKGVDNATPNPGETVVFSIVVENLGAANATGVEVTDDINLLAPNVTWVSDNSGGDYNPATGIWTVGAIANGANARLDITMLVSATGTAGNTYANTAAISAVDQTESNLTNNDDNASITVALVDVGIQKSVDNATPAIGDNVIYTLVVTNNGPGDATGVSVSEDIYLLAPDLTWVSDDSGGDYDPGTGIWTIGDLANGASATLNITVSVNGGTSITNTAIVGINEDDTDPTNDSDDATITIGGLDLALEKTVDNAAPNEGDSVVYTIVVTNNGPGDATGVTVLDTLPLEVTYDSDDGAGAYVADIWTIGDLAEGDRVTLNITATVDADTAGGSTITNYASINAMDQTDGDPNNNNDGADITVGAVDIMVEKTVDNVGPAPGDNVTYTITVTNNGPGDATGITILENLPLDGVNLTYVSDTPSQGTFTAGTPTGTWDLGDLANGASATLQLEVTVEITTGSVVNVASLDSVDQPDSDPDNNEDDATITIGGLDLGVVKTVDNPTPETGDTVIYSIVATNYGPGDATGVVVTDILPAGVTYTGDNTDTIFEADGVTERTSFDEPSGDWTIGDLALNESLTLEIEVTVDINGGAITNTATIGGDQPDPNSDNDEDDAEITIDTADLSLVKLISTQTPSVGDDIIYTVIVRNDGPSDAFNISVEDRLPSDVSYTGTNSPSQGSVTANAGNDVLTWAVGNIAVGDAATLEITVEVTGVTNVTNVAEIMASDQVDPDSTPGNGDPDEDDQADSSYIFDPPFGRKTFNDNGLPQLEWTMVWVNPGTESVTVTITDPITGGSYVNGSLSCSSPGTLVTTNCEYDIVSNSVIFEGTIFPDPGATPGNINSAGNRLIITFRVNVSDSTSEIFNRATMNTVDDSIEVSSRWERGGEPWSGDAELEIVKSVLPGLIFDGEQATWSITVLNNSEWTANDVVIRDVVPAALRIDDVMFADGMVSVSGQEVTGLLVSLEPGQFATMTIITTLVGDVPEEGFILNTGAVIYNGDEQTDDAQVVTAEDSTLPNTGYAVE